jgi:hypothetical protein
MSSQSSPRHHRRLPNTRRWGQQTLSPNHSNTTPFDLRQPLITTRYKYTHGQPHPRPLATRLSNTNPGSLRNFYQGPRTSRYTAMPRPLRVLRSYSHPNFALHVWRMAKRTRRTHVPLRPPQTYQHQPSPSSTLSTRPRPNSHQRTPIFHVDI